MPYESHMVKTEDGDLLRKIRRDLKEIESIVMNEHEYKLRPLPRPPTIHLTTSLKDTIRSQAVNYFNTTSCGEAYK